ncbi:MAG: antibiotic biosynthesis monooxygenase family protein [Pseudomonadota bacterium]
MTLGLNAEQIIGKTLFDSKVRYCGYDEISVYITTKRTLKTGESEKLLPLLKKLIDSAVKQPGYISRETLRSTDDPESFLVVSKWETAEGWKKWQYCKRGRDILGQVDVLVGEKNFYDVYENIF